MKVGLIIAGCVLVMLVIGIWIGGSIAQSRHSSMKNPVPSIADDTEPFADHTPNPTLTEPSATAEPTLPDSNNLDVDAEPNTDSSASATPTPSLSTAGAALPDPGNLVEFRNRVGETLTFRVVGRTNGTIYGTDIYTDDSDLGTAAVHAGLLKVGQTGEVTVVILAGQESYPNSTYNEVTSLSWERWDGSYRFTNVPDKTQ